MDLFYLILIPFVFLPIFAVIGFTPVYQPSHSTYPYAQLSDTTTQVCHDDNPDDILINTNDSIYGITHSEITDTNLITIDQSGVYQIIAAPQIGKTTQQANGNHDFWMVINGTDVENTGIFGSLGPLTGIEDTFVNVLNWVGYLNKDSTVSFKQLCSDVNMGIIYTNNTTPDTPSIIISIVRVS